MVTFNGHEEMEGVVAIVRKMMKFIERENFELVSYTVGTIEYEKFINSLIVALSDFFEYSDCCGDVTNEFMKKNNDEKYMESDRQAIKISEYVAIGVNEVVTINIDEFKNKLYGIVSVILGIKCGKIATSRLLLSSKIFTDVNIIKNDLTYFNRIKFLLKDFIENERWVK